MNMNTALMEKAQVSQLVPSNFLIVDSSLEVVESAMMGFVKRLYVGDVK